ncbi:MAG: hypothetical protein DRJ35_00105 [Thermoprotei archaeon]|nr:MAG: hypothetical protein DRJ35_00105 [Thermoprotei archaeon]
MELIPEVLSRLTDTERRIVETYARRGGSAKELAAFLGVSERTVYKALYKYRKIAKDMGLDPSKFYLRQSLASSVNDNGKNGSMGFIESKSIIEEIRNAVLKDIKRIVEESVKEALREVLASERNYVLPQTVESRSVVENSDVVSERLVVLMERLALGIDNLNKNIEKLSAKIDNLGEGAVTRQRKVREYLSEAVKDDGKAGLPSYVIDNPWIEVLSRR